MTEFEEIDLENKMNVLMAAINKMNTNFHLKFESLEKKLSASGGIALKIGALENKFDELNARVDEAEEQLSIATSNRDRVDALEKQFVQCNRRCSGIEKGSHKCRTPH